MIMNDKSSLMIAFILVIAAFARSASANNIAVTNVVLRPVDASSVYVQADVRWDNSWRLSWIETGVTPNLKISNWDAAWIFVKYRVNGGNWNHASLSTRRKDHVVPSGAAVSVGLSKKNGVNFGSGVFLHRKVNGSGSWTNTVRLCWNFTQDGVASTANVDVSVFAIEMVYVPQGSFYVGDGTKCGGTLCSNMAATVPFLISSEAAITLGGGGDGSLGNQNAGGDVRDDFNNTMSKTLPAEFPKGFNSFYCMKYDVTQGQWVDFFNMLTDSQKTSRDITDKSGKGADSDINRNTVSWTSGDATCTTPDRGCNFLNWADGIAYADWAGLRPMTELEFEKACRGPLHPVTGEYAWGSTVAERTKAITNDGTRCEMALNGNSNWYDRGGYGGPLRAGIYATASSTRQSSGATYWGILDMSGNLLKRTVSIGSENNRKFIPELGDGSIGSDGNANAQFWPVAAGSRGGHFFDWCDRMPVSWRDFANYQVSQRWATAGFRAVRQAPEGE